MNTQFTLNIDKIHDTLDTLRAALNQRAREQGLDSAFDTGVLANDLRDTDIGMRYRALIRRADFLAYLPDRRTAINATIVGVSIYIVARRRGWDKRALRTAAWSANALRRSGRRLRARFARRRDKTMPATTPDAFAVTQAALAAWEFVDRQETVSVATPNGEDYEVRSGRLSALNDVYFVVLVGETPYIFLPDQIADVRMHVGANDEQHNVLITLIEDPVAAATPDLP